MRTLLKALWTVVLFLAVGLQANAIEFMQTLNFDINTSDSHNKTREF